MNNISNDKKNDVIKKQKTIIFTNHFVKERLLKEKKLKKAGISQERQIKGLNKEVLSYIIQKNKINLNDNEKHLFIIEKNKESEEKYYILFAYENKKYIFISALLSKNYNLKYKNIIANNMIIIKDIYLDEIIEKFNSVKTINKENSNKILLKERKGIKKVIIDKPNENYLKFSKYLEIIKSEDFKKLSLLEQKEIILNKDKLFFYSNYKTIFDENFIQTFLEFEKKIYNNGILNFFEKNITKEYINNLCLIVENYCLEESYFDTKFSKKKNKQLLKYVNNIKKNINI